jgi:5-methylcytosine-specific restriction endonuclease McrA
MMKRVTPIDHDDNQTIESICLKTAGWSAYRDDWLNACNAYKQHKGNPWSINPTSFTPDVATQLEGLYDSRRKSGHIKKIRSLDFEGGCPVCGSLSRGDVDHYLPKSIFPEFSIFSLNLVPACKHCNSTEKGDVYRGEKKPTRFIHPYFDDLGDRPILSVVFDPPFEAVRFRAVPGPNLAGDDFEIVSFHLQKALGDEFFRHMSSMWSGLPKTVADSLVESISKTIPVATPADVQTIAKLLLSNSQRCYGLNSWPAGFYRGIIDNANVIDFIAQKATTFLDQSLSQPPPTPSTS